MSSKSKKCSDSPNRETADIDLDMTCHEEDGPSKLIGRSEGALKTDCDDKRPSSEGSKRSMILGELEDELQRQLEEKAKRNELSGNNVKSLLRAVLTQEDVFKYVESTMAKSDELPEYQLKLTRAKAKELIDRIPKIAPLLCLPTPQKKSDIDVLIREELPEDSSDEEYQPLDETIDEDEETVMNLSSDVKLPALSAPAPEPPTKPDENIGQRTRSKLSLSGTPLEAIEQAFVPPDITEDMYNTECDNQDWLNFLKDLVQPLDATGQEAHDDENDPEYNVQPDELEAPDNEELRADSAVKISKKEINDLIDELFEYTEMHEDGFPSDDEKAKEDVDRLTSELQYPGAEAPCQTPKPDDQVSGKCHPQEDLLASQQSSSAPLVRSVEKNAMDSTYSEEQHLLLRQQFAQHVQLLLQTSLLSCGNPFVNDETRESSKSCLLELKTLRESSAGESFIPRQTLDRSLELLTHYEAIVNQNLKDMQRWNEKNANYKTYVRTRWAGCPPIHPFLMKLCLRSQAFPYPLLLPYVGFRNAARARVSNLFTPAQEHLISSGLDDCVSNLGMNAGEGLMKCCDLIQTALVPDRPTNDIFEVVRRKCFRGPKNNPIGQYFLYKCSPPVEHFVVPIDLDKVPPLYLQDIHLIHISWHRSLYEEREHQKELAKKRKLTEKTVETPRIKQETS